MAKGTKQWAPTVDITPDITLLSKSGEVNYTIPKAVAELVDNEIKAMVMAYSKKRKGSIGEFGLGMKTACSNLGAEFEVVTATMDADSAIRIHHDEEHFIANGRWEIALEEVEKPFDHGT